MLYGAFPGRQSEASMQTIFHHQNCKGNQPQNGVSWALQCCIQNISSVVVNGNKIGDKICTGMPEFFPAINTGNEPYVEKCRIWNNSAKVPPNGSKIMNLDFDTRNGFANPNYMPRAHSFYPSNSSWMAWHLTKAD